MKETAIIIGAGPAGLTTAYELLTRTDIQPVVLEMSEFMGGIARTINYKGNRIDIGGHRFFSKSDRVMEWWLNLLPIQKLDDAGVDVSYRRQQLAVSPGLGAPDPDCADLVMLVRNRLSRIYFMRKFLSYPISLSVDTVRKLGVLETFLIGLSYLRSVVSPIKDEKTLEQFFINRFGARLYGRFFKSYTEKVWGVPCSEISAEWGAQRIKGLSIYKTLVHIAKNAVPKKKSADLSQKGTETSLIERFLYPKFGPGQMWEEVARRVTAEGGQVLTGWRVEQLERQDERRITAIVATNPSTGERRRFAGDYFFSTMPVRELVNGLTPAAPEPIREIANGLVYRDFLTVGVLCKGLMVRNKDGSQIKDNWIYIQEPDVLVGRLQIFNNWSPYMVADRNTMWIGLEYFCYEGDGLWSRTDEQLVELAKEELERLNFVKPEDVLDTTVIRMPKAYPAYFGSYGSFKTVSAYTDGFDNLFLVGRNGMHRYNNQDHSMLAAMTAVDNIIAGVRSRENLWALNTEMDYHEEKTGPDSQRSAAGAVAVSAARESS